MLDTSASDVDIRSLALVAHDIQLGQWTTAAAFTIFVYDLCLTSAAEYRFVWRAKWGTSKALYLLVRYPFNSIPLVLAFYLWIVPHSSITSEFCKSSAYWEALCSWMQLVITHIVIGLRVIALYDLNRSVIALVCTFGCFSACSVIIFNVIFLRNTPSFSKLALGPSLVGCSGVCPRCTRLRRFVLLPLMIYDAVVFFLTVHRYNQPWKGDTHPKASILRSLYHAGFVYFAIVFGAVFLNFAILNITRPAFLELVAPLLRSVTSVACGRLMLNLHDTFLQSPFKKHPAALAMHGATRSSNHGFSNTSASVGVWRAASKQCSNHRHSTEGSVAGNTPEQDAAIIEWLAETNNVMDGADGEIEMQLRVPPNTS